MRKIILLIIVVITSSCKDKIKKTPIEYKNYDIFLGDSYHSINQKFGKLNLDPNGDFNNNIKSYYIIPQNEIKIDSTELNSIIFLNFNSNELLISFNIDYTITNNSQQKIDYKNIFIELQKSELPLIKKLLAEENNSIVNHTNLFLRKVVIDSTSGSLHHIKYTTQRIP